MQRTYTILINQPNHINHRSLLQRPHLSIRRRRRRRTEKITATMSMMMKQLMNTIFRFNKLHTTCSSFPPHHVSRVSFTSASKVYQNRYPSEDAIGEGDAKGAQRIREAQQAYEDVDEADRVVEDIKQRAKDTARSINERAKEGTHQAGNAMHEAKERVKEGAHRAGERMHEAKEKTKDTAEWTAEKTKEGAGKAAEAVRNVGEKAKEKAQGAWETAKDATQRIKETVVGDDEDKYARPEDYIEDRLPKRPFDAGNKDQNMHRSGP